LELVGAFASVAPPGYVPAVAVMLARPLHVSKWLIYIHSNITAFTSGKVALKLKYTSWSVYCCDPVRL